MTQRQPPETPTAGPSGSQRADRYPAIADYALVGDCHTAALIARDGSVDWYCPGRFDAPAVFCRLLDATRGGYLSLSPTRPYTVQRTYRGPTNVLQTTFTTADGVVRLTDFMPVHRRTAHRRGYDVGTSGQVMRLVEGLSGQVDLALRFKPTPNYARANVETQPVSGQGAIAHSQHTYLTLACPGVELTADEEGGGALRGNVCVGAGDQQWVVLTDAADREAAQRALAPGAWAEQLATTLEYWETWTRACTYRGPYRSQVLRSALVLKLLTYEPSGAVLAAPTTSLPEAIGGARNWDYRFTWLRDASLILYALMTIGFEEEAADFLHWLEQTCGSDPSRAPQIMYGIDGRRGLTEEELSHLEGYRGSRPVRVGNAAAHQQQLDIYGEVLQAAYLRYHRRDHGGEGASVAIARQSPSPETWAVLRGLVDQAEQRWQEPGNGIWEVRGGPQDFLYGKLMCWSALDRGLRLADEHHLPAPVERWKQTRQALRDAILERGYDAERGAFTQAFGSSALDASALVIPRIGFLPPTDPRVRSTVDCIRQQLSQHGLVYRYRTPDGLAGSEGTFALCTFWLVDALALGGRLDEARHLFERVLGYANDLGLLAEEIAPDSGELLGNFPQGFSHLALIGAAVNLAKASRHGAEEQPETEGDRIGRASRAAAEASPPPHSLKDGGS